MRDRSIVASKKLQAALVVGRKVVDKKKNAVVAVAPVAVAAPAPEVKVKKVKREKPVEREPEREPEPEADADGTPERRERGEKALEEIREYQTKGVAPLRPGTFKTLVRAALADDAATKGREAMHMGSEAIATFQVLAEADLHRRLETARIMRVCAVDAARERDEREKHKRGRHAKVFRAPRITSVDVDTANRICGGSLDWSFAVPDYETREEADKNKRAKFAIEAFAGDEKILIAGAGAGA